MEPASPPPAERPDPAIATRSPAPETVLERARLRRGRESARRRSPILTAIAGLLLLALGWVGFRAISALRNPEEPEVATSTERAALAVSAVQATQNPIQAWVFGDGYARAVRFKHLTFEVDGTITDVKTVSGRDLREGDFVRQGELLARVDQRKANADVQVAFAGRTEAQQQVNTAIANLQQSQANYDQARNAVVEAEAREEQARASLTEARANLARTRNDRQLAERERDRRRQLFEQNVIPASELDVYETNLKNAEEAIAAAQAQVQSAQKQVEAAQAQVETAESQVAAAATGVRSAESQVTAARSGVNRASAELQKTAVNREDTEIRAPFNGIVAHLNIREGDYWTPQRVQASGDYQSIIERVPMVVIDPRQFEVNVSMPAYQGNQVQPGQRAAVVLEPDVRGAENMTSDRLAEVATATGRVFSVSPSVSPGERAVNVTIRITDGASSLQNNARVGVWIAVDEKAAATVVPRNAIVFRDRDPHVFVIQQTPDGQTFVERRDIERGINGMEDQEIQTGVQPGEWLVTDGKERLVDGAPVNVVEQDG